MAERSLGLGHAAQPEASGGISPGTRVHAAGLGWFRKGLSVGFGDTCHLPKGLRKVGCFGLVSEKGLPEGLPGGWHRVVRLEINGWDSSFRSDRLNCSERRWPSDSKWAAKIDSLDRAEAGIDRTERNARAMGAVGS